MKNRKSVIVAFLLVAVMLLGVGYAALTDVLDITGTADVNQSAAEESFNEDIFFSAAVANESGNTASVNADNNDKASFTANTAHYTAFARFLRGISQCCELLNQKIRGFIGKTGRRIDFEKLLENRKTIVCIHLLSSFQK